MRSLTLSGLALLAAAVSPAAPARAATHSFEARLAAAPAGARVISSELIWSCAGPTCAARGGMVDAPARLCARLARDTGGPLTAFSVNGVGFDVEKLATCNARAKARLAKRDGGERVAAAAD